MTDDQHPIPQQATWRHTGGRIWHVVWDGASDTETGRATARFHRAPTPDSRPVWNGKAWTWDPQPVRDVPVDPHAPVPSVDLDTSAACDPGELSARHRAKGGDVEGAEAT